MKCKGDPNGIRTRVTAVKGRCPGPLDDRVGESAANIETAHPVASFALPLGFAPDSKRLGYQLRRSLSCPQMTPDHCPCGRTHLFAQRGVI